MSFQAPSHSRYLPFLISNKQSLLAFLSSEMSFILKTLYLEGMLRKENRLFW